MLNKIIIIFFASFLFNSMVLAENFFFQGCKINNSVTANYTINVDTNFIEVELKRTDGLVQNFLDEIESITINKIISKKIKSTKGKNLYYQYFFNSENKTVIKIEYIRENASDINLFKLLANHIYYCSKVKAGWNKNKIDKTNKIKEEKNLKENNSQAKNESLVINCVGTIVESWTNCSGVYKDEDGLTFSGIFNKGKIFKGTLIYPGKKKYSGYFINFKPDGFGTLIYQNGDKYIGEWKAGNVEGNGTKIWKNGDKYLGQFFDNKLNGEGTFFYKNGKKYKGSFLNNKMNGDGTISYPDGSTYIGRFVSGKIQGIGECISPKGISLQCKNIEELYSKKIDDDKVHKISVVAQNKITKKQYDKKSRKAEVIIAELNNQFDVKALKLCKPSLHYETIEKEFNFTDVGKKRDYDFKGGFKKFLKGEKVGGFVESFKLNINGIVKCM